MSPSTTRHALITATAAITIAAFVLPRAQAAPVTGGSATQREAVERALRDRPDLASHIVAVHIVSRAELCRVSALARLSTCLDGIAIIRGGGVSGYADGTVLLNDGLPAGFLYGITIHEMEHIATGRGGVHRDGAAGIIPGGPTAAAGAVAAAPVPAGPRAVNPREYGERP